MKILYLCIILAAVACQKPEQQGEQAAPVVKKDPVPVEAFQAEKGIMARVISVSGTAAGIREATVVSETQGKIEQVKFDLGQWVKKGAVLVRVEASVQKSALEQAKKARASADLQLNVTQKLFDAGNASDAELKGVQNQAAGAKAALDAAQKAYSDCRVKAPISGYVASKDPAVQAGNFMSPGTRAARLVDISSLKASVSVGEMDVGLLKRGQKAKIQVPAAGSAEFDGKVTAIAAGADPSTGAYSFEVQWKNTQDRRIKSGMSVRARITTEHPDSVITVPAGAIVERDRKDALFIAVQDKAALRFVDLGRIIGNQVEISKGLAEGDMVITTGLRDLKRGELVEVTETSIRE